MPLSHMLKLLFTVWLAAGCLSSTALASMREEIDLIIVNKTERQLHLLQGEEIVRTYSNSHGPNPEDLSKAKQDCVNPGGSIMIHGLPKKFSDGANVLLDLDWTDGCIALSNNHMEEIWNLVADNTTIEILP